MEEQKIKILCVEDEQEIRENIAEILRDEGFEVFEGSNGAEGYEVFLSEKPDLVISDIMMPEVDGYKLLSMIRSFKGSKSAVPFIFLSALGQKDNVLKGVNLSANDYLIKPIDFDMMIAKVKEKTKNAIKVNEIQTRNLNNIKKQISVLLPNDVFTYLDTISDITRILEEEPYGKFSDKRYLNDIKKIYNNAIKMKAVLTNSLDSEVVSNKLNEDEEVIDIMTLLDNFINNLSQKYQKNVNFEHPFESESFPGIRIDKNLLIDLVKKIISSALKLDINSIIDVNIMIDHYEQMVMVFYFKSELFEDFTKSIKVDVINKIAENQGCRFEIVENKENTAILIIPSYRLIKKG